MDSYGALVGWTHSESGDRIMLRIESVRTLRAAEAHEPDIMRLVMTPQQAAVLGSYLTKISGLPPADPKERSWLVRLFG